MALWRDTVEAATQTQSRDRALLQTTMMRPGYAAAGICGSKDQMQMEGTNRLMAALSRTRCDSRWVAASAPCKAD